MDGLQPTFDINCVTIGKTGDAIAGDSGCV